ncbi:hypothetical protein [Nocardia sp. NPDC050710]|uniref:hypothetical protein n=1 Tax=Nocardia sp. NPDC050710 TaxID=3157220 RepID=UPI0033C1914E
MGTICPLECFIELTPDRQRWHQQCAENWVYEGHNEYRGVLVRDDTGSFHATITNDKATTAPLSDINLGDNLAHAQLAVQGLVDIEAGFDGQRALEWIARGPDPAQRALEIHDYHGPFEFLARIVVSDPDGHIHLTVDGPVEPICHDVLAPPLDQAKQNAITVLRTHLCTDLQLDIRGGPRNCPRHCRYSLVGCSLDPPSALDNSSPAPDDPGTAHTPTGAH